MVPSKSYCFLRASTIDDAQRVYSGLHARSSLAQNGGPLYLSYCHRVPAVPSTWDGPLPDGLHLVEDFVDESEAQLLLTACLAAGEDDADTDADCNALKHRRVWHFGYAFQYGTNDVDPEKPLVDRPIPSVCSALWPRLQQLMPVDAPPFVPDQLTLNAYAPGQGIPPHCDTHSPFEEPIASLSLGDSGVVMDFRRPSNGSGDDADVQRSIWLPPRSLLLMTGAARYGWTHGITPRHMDVVPASSSSSLSSSALGDIGLTVKRRAALRVSLTFRQLRNVAAAGPCRCAYAALCDSRAKEAAAQVPTVTPSAVHLEQENVHRVYDTIAGHFSETRHSPWPQVLQFVQALGAGAILADIGCGNGKYLVQEAPVLCCLGGDRSGNLLAVCRERGLNVFRCDCLQVPLRDGVADGCICIAVVHHLATEERRLQALREIARVLRPGGHALVYVWAKNQAKDSRQSSYLRQNKRNRPGNVDSNEATNNGAVQVVNGLPVHTNRTQFAAQDMLVPWKLKAATTTADAAQEFLRYYHVFEEGELEALVERIDGVRVVRGYYDQGNWCVVFEKNEK